MRTQTHADTTQTTHKPADQFFIHNPPSPLKSDKSVLPLIPVQGINCRAPRNAILPVHPKRKSFSIILWGTGMKDKLH